MTAVDVSGPDVSPPADWDELTLSEREYRLASKRYRRRRSIRAYGFIAPYFIPWVVFLGIPVVWAIFLSFNTGGIVDDRRWVGFDNWSRVWSDDELRTSIINTTYYVIVAISVVFILALGLAALLNRYRKGSNFFKLALYFPLLAPPILAAMIWFFLSHFDFGIINTIMRLLGQERINLLGENPNALLTIVGVEVWRGLGFWVLFFLAGLQSVPQELLDAARVDGARGWRRFRRVTVPTLRPLLLFALVIAIIFNFQLFDSVQVLTKGGPALGTSTVVWFIFRRMFAFQDTGLAFAASVGLLLLILVLTIISFRLLGQRRAKEA
ncbi:MAG: sugar ABC transporter permease [Proteobacteria bacterium]|nr:sugar ABC transporter permease [Pseudomonadota bacterium]